MAYVVFSALRMRNYATEYTWIKLMYLRRISKELTLRRTEGVVVVSWVASAWAVLARRWFLDRLIFYRTRLEYRQVQGSDYIMCNKIIYKYDTTVVLCSRHTAHWRNDHKHAAWAQVRSMVAIFHETVLSTCNDSLLQRGDKKPNCMGHEIKAYFQI